MTSLVQELYADNSQQAWDVLYSEYGWVVY